MKWFPRSCFVVLSLILAQPVVATEFGVAAATVEIVLPPTYVDDNGPIGNLPLPKFERLGRGFLDESEALRPLRTVELNLAGAAYEVQISELGDLVYLLVEGGDRAQSLVQVQLEPQAQTTFPLKSEHRCTFQPTTSGFEVISDSGLPEYEVDSQNHVSAPRRVPAHPEPFRDRLTGWRTIHGIDVGFLTYPWGVSISKNGLPGTMDRTIRFYVPNPINPGDFLTVRSEPSGWASLQFDASQSGFLAPLASRDGHAIVLSDRKMLFYLLESSTATRTAILKYPKNSKKGRDESFPMKVTSNGVVLMAYGGLGSIANWSISGFLPLDLRMGVAGTIHYFVSPGGTGVSAWDINASGTFVGVVDTPTEHDVGSTPFPGSTVICLYQAPDSLLLPISDPNSSR